MTPIPPPPLSERQHAAWQALRERRFFKLILGGSFTDTAKAARLAAVYAAAGADCIDIAPDAAVLEAVAEGLSALPPCQPRPLVMVSLPLDPDPHFRKIELNEPLCILCGACVPVCPTEAIEMTSRDLLISQPLCYGCGRCPVVCPTEALTLNPVLPDPEAVIALLAHPIVEAVEIHSTHADAYMWPAFEARYGAALAGKLVSVCFRPQCLSATQAGAFVRCMREAAARMRPDVPLIVQIDGEPMAGSAEAPNGSQAALEAAEAFWPQYAALCPLVTISGGVNAQTASYLRQARYAFVAGVGMGTVARRHVWDCLEPAPDDAQATHRARQLMAGFQQRPASSIIQERF